MESIRRRYPILLFTLLYLLFTNATYKDFGETFDESGVYVRGMALSHYLQHDDYMGFLHKSSADDGLVIYDHLYSAVLSWLNPSSDLSNYHWLNMVFALSAFWLLFELLRGRVKNPWLALLGPLFLALTPRFLGDIPANPKDMPFAVFYLWALGAVYWFHSRPKSNPYFKVLVLGLFFGLAEGSRLVGLTLYPVYILFDLHFFYHSGKKSGQQWKDHSSELIALLAGVFMVSSFFMVLTWPYLGANFIAHFQELLGLSKNFIWNNQVLFLGQQIPAGQLPWTYLPLWLLITTPLFILFFLIFTLIGLKKKMEDPFFILLSVALTVNAAFYLLLKPVQYDGLRHFLFLLPILCGIAAFTAAHWLEKLPKSPFAYIVLALVVLNMGTVTYHLVRLHPYEYIYFNELTGGLKGAQGKFDTDYWGASFKEAVEWLDNEASKTPNRTYKVTGSGNGYQIFYYFLPNLKWVDNLKEANYYVSYTRDNKQALVDPSKAIHVVEREGVPLNYVYKLK